MCLIILAGVIIYIGVTGQANYTKAFSEVCLKIWQYDTKTKNCFIENNLWKITTTKSIQQINKMDFIQKNFSN